MATKKTNKDGDAAPSKRMSAAEAEARNMLLAAGILPDSREAEAFVKLVLHGDTSGMRLAYSITEFCDKVGLSRSSYYRLHRAGKGPRVIEILGMPRIVHEDAVVWLHKLGAGERAFMNKPLPKLKIEPFMYDLASAEFLDDKVTVLHTDNRTGMTTVKKRLSFKNLAAIKAAHEKQEPMSSADPPPVPSRRKRSK